MATHDKHNKEISEMCQGYYNLGSINVKAHSHLSFKQYCDLIIRLEEKNLKAEQLKATVEY